MAYQGFFNEGSLSILHLTSYATAIKYDNITSMSSKICIHKSQFLWSKMCFIIPGCSIVKLLIICSVLILQDKVIFRQSRQDGNLS